MKNQSRQFVIIIVILIFLIGTYFTIYTYYQQKENKEKTSAITAFSLDNYKEVTGLTYTYNKSTIVLIKSDDTWLSKDDDSLDISSSTVEQSMLAQLAAVTADSKISNSEKISDYGFTKNKKGVITASTSTIITMDENNKCHTIYIGDANPYDSTQYYMMFDDDKTVYVTDNTIADAFSKSVDDLQEVETTTAS